MAQSGTVVNGVAIDAPGIRMGDISKVQSAIAGLGGANSQNSITAATTQTAAGASATAQLIAGINEVEVCANASDSIALPSALAGSVVIYKNNGAQTCKLFGKSGSSDTINGTAGATGITGAAAAKTGIAYCAENGKWQHGVSA